MNGKTIGKASISVVQPANENATITISTRDFMITGTITIQDGILTWGEITPNDGTTPVTPNPTQTTTTYTITYWANNGSETKSEESKTEGEDYTIATGNKFTAPNGKQFLNWTTQSDGTGTSYSAGTTYSTDAELTLYAQWGTPTSTIQIGNGTPVALTSQDVAKTYYGRTVANIGGVDYGLFYIDFNGTYSDGKAGTVYLRAKGNLSTTRLDGILSEAEQNVAVPIMKQINPDWKNGNRGGYAYGSMNPNEKGAVYLCNPNNSLWAGTIIGTDTDPSVVKEFKTKYGESNFYYIIGAPSIELFLASYNAKYSSGYSAAYRPTDKTYPGYLYLGNGDTTYQTSYSGAIANADGYMYKPASDYTLLASPLANTFNGYYVCAVTPYGNLGSNAVNYSAGVAPLVSLKSGVSLTITD